MYNRVGPLRFHWPLLVAAEAVTLGLDLREVEDMYGQYGTIRTEVSDGSRDAIGETASGHRVWMQVGLLIEFGVLIVLGLVLIDSAALARARAEAAG
jgi:hypothetical protein